MEDDFSNGEKASKWSSLRESLSDGKSEDFGGGGDLFPQHLHGSLTRPLRGGYRAEHPHRHYKQGADEDEGHYQYNPRFGSENSKFHYWNSRSPEAYYHGIVHDDRHEDFDDSHRGSARKKWMEDNNLPYKRDCNTSRYKQHRTKQHRRQSKS